MRFVLLLLTGLALFTVQPEAWAKIKPDVNQSVQDDWQLPSFNPKNGGHTALAVANSKGRVARVTKFTAPAAAAPTHTAVTEIDPQKIDAHAPANGAAFRYSSASLTAASSVHANSKGYCPSAATRSNGAPALTRAETLTHAAARGATALAQAAGAELAAGKDAVVHHLARLTAYWAGEGDYYTRRHLSSTGIHLHGGHCAVDPKIIPYGSVVEIPGFGQFLAVDTGSAVIHRTAAREAGQTRAERGALVIDLFFEHPRDGKRFAAQNPKFVSINWWTPASKSQSAQTARSFFAEEDWDRIYNKQL